MWKDIKEENMCFHFLVFFNKMGGKPIFGDWTKIWLELFGAFWFQNYLF